MDTQSLRERLITGFKPKEQDLDTPYLEGLEHEFKLVGLSGKQSLDHNEQATEQIIGKDGKATEKTNPRKLAAITVQACLRSRETNEPVFTLVDVLGPDGDGNGALMELDSSIFSKLISDIYKFTGRSKGANMEEEKKGSETTNPDYRPLSSLPESEEQLRNYLKR